MTKIVFILGTKGLKGEGQSHQVWVVGKDVMKKVGCGLGLKNEQVWGIWKCISGEWNSKSRQQTWENIRQR